MDKPANDPVATYFRQSVSTMERAAGDEKLHRAIRTIADLIESIFRSGNKLMIAGNGGSAGDAQHIAGEFLSRLNFDRAPLPAIALSTDTSVLTAIGNDYGFEHVFERQVRETRQARRRATRIVHVGTVTQHPRRAARGARTRHNDDGIHRRRRRLR